MYFSTSVIWSSVPGTWMADLLQQVRLLETCFQHFNEVSIKTIVTYTLLVTYS